MHFDEAKPREYWKIEEQKKQKEQKQRNDYTWSVRLKNFVTSIRSGIKVI